MTQARHAVIGIDTGGTFTDFVIVEGDELRVHKEPSTPDNPATAILVGLAHLGAAETADIIHGSTVATNALLERRGAKVALVTTAGFEDVLEIGRQTRSAIYDLNVTKPPPLIPTARRLGVYERVGADGTIVTPLDESEVTEVARRVAALGVESVAICLLHSYANATHERMLRNALDDVTAFCTASHEVLPEFREFERCSTTAVNAYVGPVMHRYLTSLADQVKSERIRVMQSNGGILSLEGAQRHAVQTILSGPAGGAVGGFAIAQRAGCANVITFDMGGTSTDVCLSPGQLSQTSEASIGEIPIRVPVIDIHTVGAGGGSIAYRDPGGSLRVGPRSAGAEPGPVCYGQGGVEPTVTDANLVLGRLCADHFLGGARSLAIDTSRAALADLAASLSLSSLEAAEGILRVANATMERAIRVISLERGFDPRDFTLVCFGGAGGMHAADLARSLGIPKVLVPRAAGILSALGMLLADVVRDYSQTVLHATDGLDVRDLDDVFRRLEQQASLEYRGEGFDPAAVVLERSLDMRYVGQGFELAVPLTNEFERAFHDLHRKRYGYANPSRATEVVNVRLRAVVQTTKPQLPRGDVRDDAPRPPTRAWRMVCDGREIDGTLIDRGDLVPGHRFDGPGLIVEYSTTTVVPPDYSCSVDEWGNLVLQLLGAKR